MFAKATLIATIFSIAINGWVLAQPFNAHVIHNYTVKDFKNSRQTWAATQTDEGKMIFGNSNSINLFDGEKWEYIHVPKGQTTYSLAKSEQGRIYTGGEGDFGFLKPNEMSQMQFQSLLPRLDSTYHNFQFVRQTHYLNGKVYFRTSSQLMMYDEQLDTVFVYKPATNIYNSYLIKNTIQAHIQGVGLVDLTDLKANLLDDSNYFLTDKIYGMIPHAKGQLIYFREHGLQLYDGKSLTSFSSASFEYLRTHNGYRMLQINKGLIGIATLSGGILFITETGDMLQVLTKKAGLNDDHVYGLFVDNQGLLWAMLDDGISVIDVRNGYTEYDFHYGIDGLVNGVYHIGDTYTVTTNHGFFFWDGKGDPSFKQITNSPSHSFESINIKDRVIASSQSGLYVITGDKTKQVSKKIFSKLIANDSTGIVGWGNGELSLLQIKNGVINQYKTYSDISYPKSWSLNNQQLYLLTINDQLLRINLKSGVIYNIETENAPYEKYYIGKVQNETLVGTSNGVYKVEQNKLVATDSRFDELKNITLFKDCMDEIWMRAGTDLIRFTKNRAGLWDKESAIFNNIGNNEGYFTISCYSDATWFGLENKIIRIPKNYTIPIGSFQTNISSVKINSDSLIYNGFGRQQGIPVLKYKENQMRFEFAAAFYLKSDFNTYQFKLEGFESDWSKWTTENHKDYTNIPEGTYTFKVKGRNIYENEGSEASFNFQILPPWYRTWWAYLVYLIFISLTLYTIHKIRLNQLLKVERVRNRIASDLHDEVSATLTSIYYFAEAIERYPDKMKSGRFVHLILESAFEAKEKITDIVWSINPEYDDWQEFLAKCRRYASDLFESKDIKYELNITGDAVGKMDMEFRQHIWLIYKELLTNAVRHAQSTKVEVVMTANTKHLTLIVQDNGKGFDLVNTPKGNGLTNIEKRATQIKAKIHTESKLGYGTRSMLTVYY
ncbi:MAG: triple tyrosine motif-containing protein [Balneolaceae bacterium]